MGTIPAIRMRASVWTLPALGLFCASTVQAQAAAYVLGDSLGLGVARAAHLKNLSKISIHIRGSKMLKQIAQTPSGSTVFLVLGTNDANGSIARLDKSIDAIVHAMERKNLTVVWMGPPCVRKSWDTRARDLDTMLKNRFENTAVRYVSMRDEEMCSGVFHERDGVHLKTRGYAHMWEKARSAVSFAVAAAEPEHAEPDHDAAPTGSVTKHTASTHRSKKAKRIPLPVPRKPLP
jgi:hypothetical protein